MGFPVREGVVLAKYRAAVTADGEMAFGTPLIKGGDHGVQLFMAVGADDAGFRPVEHVTAIEADGLCVRVGRAGDIREEVEIKCLREPGAAAGAHAVGPPR